MKTVMIHTVIASKVNGQWVCNDSIGKRFSFTSKSVADQFASSATLYGKPAKVVSGRVPKHIADRQLCS